MARKRMRKGDVGLYIWEVVPQYWTAEGEEKFSSSVGVSPAAAAASSEASNTTLTEAALE